MAGLSLPNSNLDHLFAKLDQDGNVVSDNFQRIPPLCPHLYAGKHQDGSVASQLGRHVQG
ncbi:Bgt-1029-2 [Blumeria graminis f. sp. tritici]|uniref:Bgt-1029-2 n=2 Tax=Blumeria graminis f. sp. tritici TaxID=62690 RepID=A0A061HFF7_BLUGR|nr:hypothetical protein BGT96224_1029B [Blumeria graminis f. sp. tritici 96224]VDB88060.1 Bgt-1029-2 [Blumeria graminis f. sp. tritici]